MDFMLFRHIGHTRFDTSDTQDMRALHLAKMLSSTWNPILKSRTPMLSRSLLSSCSQASKLAAPTSGSALLRTVAAGVAGLLGSAICVTVALSEEENRLDRWHGRWQKGNIVSMIVLKMIVVAQRTLGSYLDGCTALGEYPDSCFICPGGNFCLQSATNTDCTDGTDGTDGGCIVATSSCTILAGSILC